MKIFVVCQSGLGTSSMTEINIKQAFTDLGADVDELEVSHTDVGNAPSDMVDYFFIEHFLKDTLTPTPDEKLVSLQSIIDSEEVKEKVAKTLSKEQK